MVVPPRDQQALHSIRTGPTKPDLGGQRNLAGGSPLSPPRERSEKCRLVHGRQIVAHRGAKDPPVTVLHGQQNRLTAVATFGIGLNVG